MSTRELVLCDGDLPALVAAAAAAERAIRETDPAVRPVLLPFPSTLDEPRLAAVAALGRTLGLSVLPAIAPASHAADAEGLTRDLLAAGYGAARAGIDLVTWPITACTGESLNIDLASAHSNRALLVGRLVALDDARHLRDVLRIDTPYLDLSDSQIADLAADLAVPLKGVWWWGGGSGEAARARARWAGPLAEAGWPLTPGAVA